jgi:hypothetical protein
MRQTSFENFIRFGSSKSFTLNLGNAPKRQAKQDNPAPEATTRDWIDQVWNKSFGATTQAILKTPPEQSFLFRLMMATRQTQFIDVTQMIYGRSQFVYAVRWHQTAKGGYVQDMFPRCLLCQPPLIWP